MVLISHDVFEAKAAQSAPVTEFAALPPDAQLRVLAEVRSALLKMTRPGAARREHPRLAVRHSHEHSDYTGHRHSHVHEHHGNADHHHVHTDADVAVASSGRAARSRRSRPPAGHTGLGRLTSEVRGSRIAADPAGRRGGGGRLDGPMNL